MARRFVSGNEIRFTSHDRIFLDVETSDGEHFTDLEPRRLFPISGAQNYITFLNSSGEEEFILRSLSDLEASQFDMLDRCLWEYYRIPKITRLIERSEKNRIWLWTVDTDRGVYRFEIQNVLQSIKMFYDRRILIKDAKDNRYEIPDIYKLDKRSIRLILPEM